MLISKTTSIEGVHDIMPSLHHALYYIVVLTNHSKNDEESGASTAANHRVQRRISDPKVVFLIYHIMV